MVRTARSEATRTALGPTLVRLCREGLDIVCIDAALGYSTSAVKFGQEFPDRFFPVGVAEQNMIGVSAGLAACGKIAFCSSFAVFAPGHCFDQLRMAVGQPQTNVKLVASHGGVVTGEDGASAEALEDIALMLSIPTFRVIFPADVVEAEQAIETAAIVTAEDHFVHGGLSGLVAEALAEENPVPLAFIGMRDRYGTSGTSDELLEYFGLTPQAIVEAVRGVMSRKSH